VHTHRGDCMQSSEHSLKAMQTQQSWPTRADRTVVQACMERACKEQIRGHIGLVNVGFVDVDFVAGYVCGNMHNAQGKACAGGLYGDHPVYCCVVQVGSRYEQVHCLALNCTVAAHRCARAQSYLEQCSCIRTSSCVCASSCHTIREE